MLTKADLESMLEGGVETQTLDVKESCFWNADSMAKDILAMSNVQDGGHIIIGVKDGGFVRQGIQPEHKKTYKIDVMKDQIAKFPDPHVDFTVEFPLDKDDREYAVIHVFPFAEQPIICRTGGKEVRAGVVYYRNRTGRIQSAAVSNAHDMRDILTTATVKMMQYMARKGLTVPLQQSTEERLREKLATERNGL